MADHLRIIGVNELCSVKANGVLELKSSDHFQGGAIFFFEYDINDSNDLVVQFAKGGNRSMEKTKFLIKFHKLKNESISVDTENHMMVQSIARVYHEPIPSDDIYVVSQIIIDNLDTPWMTNSNDKIIYINKWLTDFDPGCI